MDLVKSSFGFSLYQDFTVHVRASFTLVQAFVLWWLGVTRPSDPPPLLFCVLHHQLRDVLSSRFESAME